MIKIGNNSFSIRSINTSLPNVSKSFHILNCESLESIQIGQSSFWEFAGEFELKNLPQLQYSLIGVVGDWSRNFHNSSFVIQGIDMMLNI